MAPLVRLRTALVVVGLALAALVASFGFERAAFAYTPPPIEGPVTDPGRRLAPADKAALAEKLAAYRTRTGHEVTVLVAPSLEGEGIRDVAYDTARAWKLGAKGTDDGVLLVIAPTERKIHLETGRGVGGALTDVEAARIAREVIGPKLKVNDFRGAIDDGTSAIFAALDRDPSLAPPAQKPRAEGSRGGALLGLLFLALVFGVPVLILVLAVRAARKGGGGGGGFGGGSGSSGGGGFWIGGFGGGGGGSSSWGDSGGSSGGGGGDWGGGGGDWGGGGGGSDY